MCMMSSAPPSAVEVDPEVVAVAGKGITNTNPLFKTNKPRRARMVMKSMRINKPN